MTAKQRLACDSQWEKGNTLMMIQSEDRLRWIVVAGFVGLFAVGGCSTRSVTVSSSGGAALQEAPAKGLTKAPVEEVVKPMEIAKTPPQEKVPEIPRRDLLNVYFAFDKWSLTPEGKKNLVQNAEELKRHSAAKLLIEGHCDERGSREYNLVLGERRAQETRRYLQALGITNPVSVTSYGKERPVCTEHDESCYWKNRRAHLIMETGNGQ